MCLVSASNKSSYIAQVYILSQTSLCLKFLEPTHHFEYVHVHDCVGVHVYRYMYFIDCLGHGVLTYLVICGLSGWLGILEFKCWEVCIHVIVGCIWLITGMMEGVGEPRLHTSTCNRMCMHNKCVSTIEIIAIWIAIQKPFFFVVSTLAKKSRRKWSRANCGQGLCMRFSFKIGPE